jgi:hypothetical protein
MKKILVIGLIIAILAVGAIPMAAGTVFAAPVPSNTPTCNVTGPWVINFSEGATVVSTYSMTLTQTGTSLSGSGGSSNYTWNSITGSVLGSTINLVCDYPGGSPTPATLTGTIASNGTMSGTWDEGSWGSGTWATTNGPTISPTAAVTLLATANQGYAFVNWTGGNSVVSTNASYSFTANSDETIVANFTIVPPISNVTGTWDINVIYSGVTYPETLILAQTGNEITGTSVNTIPPATGSAFTITGGSVIGNTITFTADQNATSLVTNFSGTIASDGSMSGSWADESPGTRTGTWATFKDSTPPTVTAAVNPVPNDAGYINSSLVTVTLTATDTGGSGVKEISYSVNGAPLVVVTGSTASFSESTDGTYMVTYSAEDNVGNTGTGTPLTFKIDTTLPVVTITAPANGDFYQAVNVPTGVFTVTTEANPYTYVESGWSNTDGVQTYIVTATDAAGNVGSASATYTVETTAPTILINYPAPLAIYKLGTMPTSPDITVSDEYDDSPNVAVTGYNTTLGTHTMTVMATDLAGNTSTTSIIYMVQTNPKASSDTPPVINILSPQAKTYYTYQTLKIVFGAYDTASGVATKTAILDSTRVSNLQKIDLSTLPIGKNTFTVTATDNMGETSTKTVTFTVAVGVLKATIFVRPSIINLKNPCNNNAVTATIFLPCGVSEKNIILSTVTMTINGVTIPATSVVNGPCGCTDRFAFQSVITALNGKTGTFTVTVSGALQGGTTFSGTDTITVTNGPTPKNDGGCNKN